MKKMSKKNTKNGPKITGEHFYKFFQCPHWIWYDIYEDSLKKKESSPLLEMIYRGKVFNADGVLHEHKKFEEIRPELLRDIEEGFLATLELMKKGKNIYHGVLMHEDWAGIPDLLEARPGKSELGDWHYVVYDVQQSLDLRDEYKFPLVFYSLILERLQGVRPKEAYVIDSQGNERSFLVDDYVDQLHITREDMERVLDGEKPPPFLKSGCRRTPWYSLCVENAKDCDDISLIYRLSQSDQRHLYNIGIKTVKDFAESDVNWLQSKLEEWQFDKIIRFSNQAKVLISEEPFILKKPNFVKVRYEIYFDVESDPMRDVDYLLGVLIKDTEKGTVEYKKFMAKDKEDESVMWKKFLDFLVSLEDFVIYHYAYYEKQVFDRLTLQYGAPTTLINKFREHAVDLHLALLDIAVMPLYFYTLKDVARYIGYEWNDPGAGGAESVVWYNEWLETKNDPSKKVEAGAIIKKIIKYNEDDVRATLLIKEWLEKQKPSRRKESFDEV